MAIIIPSKNIYSKNNEKIKDNLILGTTIKQTAINEASSSLVSLSWQPYTLQTKGWFNKTTTFTSNTQPNTENIDYNYNSAQELSWVSINIDINSEQYIDVRDLYFNVSIKYVRSLGTNTINEVYTEYLTDEESRSFSKIKTGTHTIINAYGLTPSLSIILSKRSPATDQPSKTMRLNINLPLRHWRSETGTTAGDINCVFITDVAIEIYSNTLDFNNTIIRSYGENTTKTIELPHNELDTVKHNNISMFDYLSKKVVESYRNGKETATILASIGEYYHDNGTLAISTKKQIDGTDRMTFEIGNETIPMVCGTDGNDYPMSRYRDGTPKIFRVCGTKIYYDGAVWQELTLQEK